MDTLVAAGYPSELAYFECLHELKFIVDLIHEAGISGMRKLISDTAKWGELTVGPRIIDQTVQRRMRAVLKKIRSGQFAREFIRELKPPRRRYVQLLRDAENHPIEKVGARLRGMMAGAQINKPPSALPRRQRASAGDIVGDLVISPYDGLQHPLRHAWSELQLAGRKVAECGSLRSPCSTSSLWFW